MATDAGAADPSLEQELDRMLEIEKFQPPEEFRERASWSDPKFYEEAAADPVAWWTARSKELLDWDVEPTEGLNDSDPPFYKWFEDGRINASPSASTATSRRGTATASPTTGAARRGRSATSPTPTSTATCSASPTR